MLVSTSFLKEGNYSDFIKTLNDSNTDLIHFDVMDGKFVKNTNLKSTKELEKYIKALSLYDINNITIHKETKKYENMIDLIKSYGIKAGLAIKPNTNVRDLIPYLPYINMILVMSVEPGEGGQSFIEGTENKIKEIRELLKSYNLNDIIISVDGGVNSETIDKCRLCDRVVSGSYILSSNNFSERIDSLR